MDVALGNDGGRPLDENREQIERFRREMNLGPLAKELTALAVKGEDAETHGHDRSPGNPRVFPGESPDSIGRHTAPSRHVRSGRECEARDGGMDSPDIPDLGGSYREPADAVQSHPLGGKTRAGSGCHRIYTIDDVQEPCR